MGTGEVSGREHEYDLVVRGERVLVAGGEHPREVGVVGGVVRAIEPLGAGLDGARVVELGPHQVLVPGLVDTHVHVNEPGRTSTDRSVATVRRSYARVSPRALRGAGACCVIVTSLRGPGATPGRPLRG